MLKNLLTQHPIKWIIGSAFALLIITTLARANISLADFTPWNNTTANQAAPAPHSASISMQELDFGAAYFVDNGQLNGLAALPTGLSLAAGQTEGSYTSAVVQSPLGYTTDVVPLWQVNLPEGTSMRLETRLSLDGSSSWSDWLDNPAAFYPVRDNLHSGNLIWAGNQQVSMQFRVTLHSDVFGLSPEFNSLKLVFSDTSNGPTDGEIASQIARVSAADNVCPVDKPAVVSRTDWGCPDGQNSPRRAPQYAEVTHVIVHQTETPNNTAPYQDYAGWVRSVWNYHTNVLRWGDVGYNYLVDPNGIIYEGRAGGENVVGVHDTHNYGSMGIGFIGCYGNCDDPRLTVAEPSAEMLNSATSLMAWKLGEQDIDPLSSSDYDGLADIPVIAGGRDVVMTSAPGDNVYNKLPEMRTAAADKNTCEPTPTPTPAVQACQITGTIFDQEAYQIGDTIHTTVRLADFSGTPLVGANVVAEVVRQPIQAQAATGFDLVDRSGDYDGIYGNTELPGLYNFSYTASDPTGQRFLPCYAETSVYVLDPNSTVTPSPLPTEIPETPTITPTIPIETPTITPTVPVETPTITPTAPVETPTPTATPETPEPSPTPTNTPTATPDPDKALVKITPQDMSISVCTTDAEMAVTIENVENLAGIEFEVKYDPNVVQIVDANPDKDGVQVAINPIFNSGFIAQNIVDTTAGSIKVGAVLLSGDKIDGGSELFSFTLDPQAPGSSAFTFNKVLLASTSNQPIASSIQNGMVSVSENCSAATGTLALQGRTDHSGITVTNANGQKTQTDADGSFSIVQSDSLTFEHPGYLSAQATISQQPGVELQQQVATVGNIVLLAGDINGDNQINILDLAYIAKYYGSADTLADLNADGKVDILDLVLSASNYGQAGPLTAWAR